MLGGGGGGWEGGGARWIVEISIPGHSVSAVNSNACPVPTPRKKPWQGGEPPTETQLPKIPAAGNFEDTNFFALSSMS